MRAVVTGGAGFIGSTIVDALVADGTEVLVVDDMSHGFPANLEAAIGAGAARLVELDIRDGERLTKEVTSFGPDLVFHLAAQIDVRRSMSEPAHDASVNIVGSLNVFSAAAAAGARRVVNTSTGGAMYGVAEVVPTPETSPAAPISGYGMSKNTAERYARWFGENHGLDVVTLRYGNVYGPRQDPRGDAGVIAIFCGAVLDGRRPTIFGDGTQTRDYVFVGDIAAANLAVARAEGLTHDVFNIGTGQEVSLLELVAAIAEAAGVDPADFVPVHDAPRAGELLRSCLDVSRARADFGLAPPIALTEGLRRTLDWVRTLPPAG
ncbi:NAD-dependent epimerase/dehydratase family protein [Pseudonocardia lacus]|uniref:NAD-dependent epimerase/dehydratase family protein n=1 Tax=Pseudonocardia lacus TaxID=2835865 RepID=UPI001BDDC059|nr:NAD-dependent epimerase/dehydratase family protein [Pseudonocardia lacus]